MKSILAMKECQTFLSNHIIFLIQNSHLPVILVATDTYTTASDLRNTMFKLTPDDAERIEWALCLMAEYVDIDGLLESLN